MSVRIGISPLTWSNDDMPELGGDTPLETCLAEAREAGYEGVEMGRKFPRGAADLRPVLGRHGLSLVSGWYGAGLTERGAEISRLGLRRYASRRGRGLSLSLCFTP